MNSDSNSSNGNNINNDNNNTLTSLIPVDNVFYMMFERI